MIESMDGSESKEHSYHYEIESKLKDRFQERFTCTKNDFGNMIRKDIENVK